MTQPNCAAWYKGAINTKAVWTPSKRGRLRASIHLEFQGVGDIAVPDPCFFTGVNPWVVGIGV
jgi:hypothetical protein